jgi:5'-3' exonuclease
MASQGAVSSDFGAHHAPVDTDLRQSLVRRDHQKSLCRAVPSDHFSHTSDSLDMNGIIHNCTHPPSSEGNASFRLTEQQMILAIFAYIDHLFSKIKPRKVFFMAVDGVAPRAKMNQQRSRRFRTAQEAKELEEKARRKGEELPKEAAFDSNCITPGAFSFHLCLCCRHGVLS